MGQHGATKDSNTRKNFVGILKSIGCQNEERNSTSYYTHIRAQHDKPVI